MRDRPVYNHLGYTQDGNLTNPKPNPNPNRIRTNQTRHPHKNI